jgi:hypothetical protein
MDELQPDQVLAVLALQQLIAEYCHELDCNAGRNAPTLFSDDGVMQVGKMSYSERAAMQAFYDDLAKQIEAGGPGAVRTTRHVCSNLRIAFQSSDRATVQCLMVNYSAAGQPPVFDATVPTVVSDTRFECAREANRWRIKGLFGGPVFVGNDPLQNKVLVG